MENVKAGDGGAGASGTDKYGNTITELGARGTPGGIAESYNSIFVFQYCANTTLNIHRVHYGTGLHISGGTITISVLDCFKSKINIVDDLNFELKEATTTSYRPEFYTPSYHITCVGCTDVDATLTFTKSTITLPDYGNLYWVNASGDRARYSVGGSVGTQQEMPLMIGGNPTFPSSYSSNGTYGMRVTMSKPLVFYGGYPSGGSNGAYGVVVHGADGLDKEYKGEYVNWQKGGDASNEFTYNGLHVSAGTPGKGTYDAPDGRLVPESPYTINSTTSKDVEITFI